MEYLVPLMPLFGALPIAVAAVVIASRPEAEAGINV